MLKRVILIASVLAMVSGGVAFSKELPINPITPDVKDKLKQSVDLVSNVDDSIAPKVKDLEKIYKAYEPCLKAPGDKGCVQLKEQVGEKYEAVLNAIGDALPKMKKAITDTAAGLGQSIQRQTRTKDIKSLYDHVSTKARAPVAKGPLSKKLSSLLEALGGSSNLSSL